DRFPLVEILEQTPEIPPTCQWAIFLRNHDELTLEMVTSKERDYMYSIYAADQQARVNLGIRRRLATLLDNDMDRIKLMNRLLLVRSSSQAFGRGTLSLLKPGNRKVLAYLREYGEDVILCVANVARSAQPVELDLARYQGRVPVELLGRTAFPPIGELPYLLTIAAHGFYWFRLATDVPVPSWHTELRPAEDRPVLVLFDGWSSLFR